MRDTRLGRTVALKVLSPSLALNEARQEVHPPHACRRRRPDHGLDQLDFGIEQIITDPVATPNRQNCRPTNNADRAARRTSHIERTHARG